MARTNRVDPYGDLHAVPDRQGLTGNRGCLVDDDGRLVRHHHGQLWITCELHFGGRRHPLAAPRTWTPLFFLDDAVGLAAGHRPCGRCRRPDHLAYRTAVTAGLGAEEPVLAHELNRRLSRERLRRGRGLDRADDRMLTWAPIEELPAGSVVGLGPDRQPHLVGPGGLQRFSFSGWGPVSSPPGGVVAVITPPTSIVALSNGFVPRLHPSATSGDLRRTFDRESS